jgi:hypothetical protein
MSDPDQNSLMHREERPLAGRHASVARIIESARAAKNRLAPGIVADRMGC